MKKSVIFLLLLFFTNSFSQTSKIEIVQNDKFEYDADIFVGKDGLGYYYFIKNDVFIKKSKTEIFEYKNLVLGKIEHVDIENPLKIVLFYENFNTIITLDNQLNETNKLNLSDFKTPIVAVATGMASQNRFWIYNDVTQQIGLFDFTRNNYTSLTQSLYGNVKYYETDFNTFQWIDEKLNYYSCSVFGQIANLGKVKNFDSIQFVDLESVIFSVGNNLYYYNLKLNLKEEIKITEESIKSFFFKDQILSIFTAKGITNYKIKIP